MLRSGLRRIQLWATMSCIGRHTSSQAVETTVISMPKRVLLIAMFYQCVLPLSAAQATVRDAHWLPFWGHSQNRLMVLYNKQSPDLRHYIKVYFLTFATHSLWLKVASSFHPVGSQETGQTLLEYTSHGEREKEAENNAAAAADEPWVGSFPKHISHLFHV